MLVALEQTGSWKMLCSIYSTLLTPCSSKEEENFGFILVASQQQEGRVRVLFLKNTVLPSTTDQGHDLEEGHTGHHETETIALPSSTLHGAGPTHTRSFELLILLEEY